MREAIDKGRDAGTFLFGRNGAMLRKIIDGAAIGMAVAGMDGRVVYTNHAFARDFSSTDRSDAFDLHSIFAVDDHQARKVLANVLEGRSTTHEGEYRCRDAAVRRIWAIVALSVLDSTSPAIRFTSLRKSPASTDVGQQRRRWSKARAAGILRSRPPGRAYGITTPGPAACSTHRCGGPCAVSRLTRL